MTMSSGILQALEVRGLDVELAVRLGLDSIRRDGTDWLIFPCFRGGRIHRRKMRTLGAEKRFHQEGDGPIPWNEDVLRDESMASLPLIITEGEVDALTAIQCGFVRAISVPDGAPMEASKEPFGERRYAWVKDVAPLMMRQHVPEIILAVDGDEPGHALMQDLSVMLGRSRCKFLTYPLAKDGRRLKDLNDVLMEYGHRGVTETLNRARFIQSDGVYSMDELPELPPSVSYRAGYPLLDENYRLRLGDFCVVTGIPSHGKSVFVNDYLCRIANQHGFRIVWASFEQEPKRDHRRLLRTWYWGEGEEADPTPEWKQTDQQKEWADAWIKKHHRFILADEDADVTLDWILERMEQAVIQHDCQVVVIDPWNEMDHMRERDETETEYVGRAIKRFKRFATAFQVHLVVVAHPTKLRRDADGSTPMPMLYDIAGSAHWANKADVAIVVHRQTEEDTIIKVAKSRYHSQIGEPGSVKMHFGKDDAHFHEIERLA